MSLCKNSSANDNGNVMCISRFKDFLSTLKRRLIVKTLYHMTLRLRVK